MSQPALFHDTIYDALAEDISAAGGFKVVAGKLWPSESPTTAAAKLRNSINPDQPHKLCPDEVLQIKRLAHASGSSAAVQYEAQQLSYRIEWITPEDELSELQHRIADGMELLQREIKRANDLMARSNVRAVK
ncbi:MAG TPA: hypothetical protein VGN16_19685 [Acidobacteriaceae bacterium]|jgi:hypothetical protein